MKRTEETMPKAKRTKPRMSDLLTTGEFGRLVNRTSKCIRDWIHNGTIPADAVVVVNGRFSIRRWAVEEVTE